MGAFITALIAILAVASVFLMVRAKVREAAGNGCSGCSGCSGHACGQCEKNERTGEGPPCK